MSLLRTHHKGPEYSGHWTTLCGRSYHDGDRINISGENTDSEADCKVCIRIKKSGRTVASLLASRKEGSRTRLRLIRGGLYDATG